MTLDEVIKDHVLKTLSQHSKVQSCRILGITRRTLYNYLRKWGRDDLMGRSGSAIREEQIGEMYNLEPWQRDFIENSDFLRSLPESKPCDA